MGDRKVTIVGPPQVRSEAPMIYDPETGEEVPATVYFERKRRAAQPSGAPSELPALDLSQPSMAPRRIKPKQQGTVGDDPSNRILQAVLERMRLSGGLLG